MVIKNKKNRFYEIDMLRFVAAISVMLYHYGFRGQASDNLTDMPYPYAVSFVKYGYLGVNLFFIISGFVIFMTASQGSVRRFCISRLVRLYPAFWVCCTITFIVTLVAGGVRFSASWHDYAVNMTMLSGFLNVKSIDGSYWSLFVEIKFYALVFIVLIFRQMHHSKVLLGFWLAMVIIISQWSIRYVGYFIIPDYAAYFVAGAMFYLVYFEGICFYKLFIIMISFLVALVGAINKNIEMTENYHSQFDETIIAIILALFYMIFFLISTGRTRSLSSESWVLLGALTYPLYLIHQFVGYMIFNLAYPFFNPHIIMLGTIVTMLLIAYIIDIKIEKPYSKPLKALLERLFRVRAALPRIV